MTEEFIDYTTRISFSFKSCLPHASPPKEPQEHDQKTPTKEGCRRLNKQCIVLLQNLIGEQMTHRFDKKIRLNELNPSNSNQFKFFLNSMEILCHYLNIIDLNNYSYRTQNYGNNEVLFQGNSS